MAGLGALAAPIEARLPRRAAAWVAVSPLPLVALSLDGRLSRLDGALLVTAFAAVMLGLARTPALAAAAAPAPRPFVLRLAGGAVVLTVAGELVGRGIRGAASTLGVGDTLLGNTVVAASVEAEEVGRVAVASRRGRPDVALGNLAGTVGHFVAFNAGVIALVRPLELDDATLRLHLPAAAASAVLLAALSVRGLGRRAGAVLVALYAAYVAAAVAA